MSGPAGGGVAPGEAAPDRSAPRDDLVGILPLLALGLALRLIILAVAPGSGFAVDLDAFRFWAADLARNGPFGFYERGFFADYTPGYLYLLWLVGVIGGLLRGPEVAALGDLIKLPAILADVAVAWLIRSLAIELGATNRRALAAAALFLLFPVSWFDSALWGQVDSVGVVFLLLGVRSIWRGNAPAAAVWATLAAVVKPQLGILVPILAAWVIGRLLAERRTAALAVATARDGSAPAPVVSNPIRAIGFPILAAAATATAASAPFGLTLLGLFGQVASAAAGYPYASVNAYNPWALATVDGRGVVADGTWVRDAPGLALEPYLAFGPVPAVVVGTVLLLIAIVAIGAVVVRRPTRGTVIAALAVLAIAFFVVPTRVHERYLFPFIPLALILAARSDRWRLPWLAGATTTTLGMYVVLTTLYPGNPGISDWLGIGPAIRSAAGVTTLALIHVALLARGVTLLRHRAIDELEATPPEPAAAAATVAVAVAAADVTPAPVRAAPAPPPAVPEPVGAAAPSWLERPDPADPGLLAEVRRRLLARPLRADRSAALVGEPGGRLDRLDLWIVVVLVVLLLAGRAHRLEQPYQMHFDEVYHARTATEFLQHWRYGEPHPIYEFTHPHLAKYAMAAGLVMFGGDRVVATSSLGAPVAAAAIEGRWEDPRLPAARAGDRLYLATGSDVRVIDLARRSEVVRLPIPGARSLAVSSLRHELYVGTDSGTILALATAALDDVRLGVPPPGAAAIRTVAEIGAPVARLHAAGDGATILAVAGDEVVALASDGGAPRGRLALPGATGFADAGTAELLVARPAEVPDPVAAARVLTTLLGGSDGSYVDRLGTGAGSVTIAPAPRGDLRGELDAALGDGRLAGFELITVGRVAVGATDGIALVATADPVLLERIGTTEPVTGLAATTNLDATYLYAATGESLTVAVLPSSSDTEGLARVSTTVRMPGAVRDVAWNPATQMIHALGRAPAGSDGETVYVVEPHGNAVFADARLPFAPAALVVDAAPRFPNDDRQELLAFAADGSGASVAVGAHAFAWRLPGVLAGLLGSLALYLLARILFRRRSVAVFAAVLAGLDGMLFVQSRIGMNDAYVGALILAAIAAFAGLWTGRWRSPAAFWVVMPVVGILLGLALAAKWVALYAIAGLGILVLARSALGRVILVGGLLAATAVLGLAAISVPAGGTSGGNLSFVLAMIAVSLVAVAISVLRPVAWTLEELRFAVAAPLATGVAILLIGIPLGVVGPGPCADPAAPCPQQLLLEGAFGLVVLSGLALGAARLAAGVGWGPLADPGRAALRALPPASPAPEGWLRLGSGRGLPAVWLVVSLLAIPVAVYVASYLPWVALGNRLVESWPPGNAGQTLADLTASMYRYHDDLRAAHAASSPWWAWPFDLKPVWFYQGGFESATAGAIYDAGNLVVWWLAIPALGFAAWAAYRRRSHALALVVVAFLALWLPWARIDRATFQYHYYTALPFAILALAYLAAELWHGPPRGVWLLARVSAGLAIVGPLLLWLLRLPLCALIRVEGANPGSEACALLPPGEILVTARTAGLLLVALVGGLMLVRGILSLGRPGGRSTAVVIGAVVTSAGLVAAGRLLDETPLLRITAFPPEAIALVAIVPVGSLAWHVATASDPRRFVAGILVAAAGWFVLWYPNLSGLPLPSALFNAYQGLLPTYLYPFQFPVNLDPPGEGPPLASLEFAILALAIAGTAVAVAWSASSWRLPGRGGEAGPPA
ncbi:MAG: hypothetical protein RL338_710 [Chloroflexota bacterium]